MILSINDKKIEANNIESLSSMLASIKETFCEIWLEEPDGPSLACFKSGSLCFLMYLREPEDSGFTSRSDVPFENDDAIVEFYLSNGQRDEYPVSWTIHYDQGRKALEYFHFTKKMFPEITWHED